MKSDLIGVVESAYNLEGDDQVWLGRVAERVRPHIDQGMGLVGWFVSAGDGKADTRGYVNLGAPQNAVADIQLAHSYLKPTDVAASYGRHIPFGYGSQIMTRPIWDSLWARMPPGTREGWNDCLNLIPQDPWGNGLLLSALSPKLAAARPRGGANWARIAAHLSAALRLRRLLHPDPATEPEAILTPDGKMAHGTGKSRQRDARESLRETAVAVDRARGRLRRTDPAAAIRLWHGMIQGRWSLVDRFDADGRRFLLAYRNSPTLAKPRTLTEGERNVLAFSTLGHSNKDIAYELGFSVGAVTAMAASLRRRMGIQSQAELIEVAARLCGPK